MYIYICIIINIYMYICTLVDVDTRNANLFFFKFYLSMINFCQNSCRLKISTAQTSNVPSVRAGAHRIMFIKEMDQ